MKLIDWIIAKDYRVMVTFVALFVIGCLTAGGMP
jgi:hypothetical protein